MLNVIKCALQKSLTIIIFIFNSESIQVKSNVGFRGDGKTGVQHCTHTKPSQSRVENQKVQPTYDIK